MEALLHFSLAREFIESVLLKADVGMRNEYFQKGRWNENHPPPVQSIKEESLFSHIFRKAEISHFASGANFAFVA